MFSALFSFLGGSVFRMVWGEVSAWMTAKQEHANEMERLRQQSDVDEKQHVRDIETIKLQSDLGVKLIQVQRDVDVDRIVGDAWSGLVKSTTQMTGIKFVDIWNQSVRPLLATMAIVVVVAEVASNGFALNEWDQELVGAILGIYVADRSLTKRGK